MVEGLLQEPRAIAWVFRGAQLEVVDRGLVELGEDRLLAQERAHRRDDLLVESQDVGLDRLDPRVHGRVAAQLLPEVVGIDVGRGVHGGNPSAIAEPALRSRAGSSSGMPPRMASCRNGTTTSPTKRRLSRRGTTP